MIRCPDDPITRSSSCVSVVANKPEELFLALGAGCRRFDLKVVFAYRILKIGDYGRCSQLEHYIGFHALGLDLRVGRAVGPAE